MHIAATPNIDTRIRLRAFEWLKEQVDREGEVLPRPLLAKGFEMSGSRIRT